MSDDITIRRIIELSLTLTPADQYRVAFFIAENIGFCLKRYDGEEAIEEIMKTIDKENNT